MVLRKFMGIFAITLIVCSASLAMAGIPDASRCDSNRIGQEEMKAVLLVVPSSAALRPFDTAHPAFGFVPETPVYINATIEVTVNDNAGAPIANYPFEDIWLECPAAGNPPGDSDTHVGFAACTGGATADVSTDVAGMTLFNNPPYAGGQSWGPTRVVVNGDGLPNTVDVSFNSPDLDGNGAVNLIDLQSFTEDYFDSDYHYRSDLFYTNSINVADLQTLAEFYGSQCP